MTAVDAEHRGLLWLTGALLGLVVCGCAAAETEAPDQGGGGGAGGGGGGGSTSTTSFTTQSTSNGAWTGEPPLPDCPSMAPTSYSECPQDLTNRTCAYGATQCTCGQIWFCNECPPEPPSNGGVCPVPNAFCAYGFLSCGCSNPNSQTQPGEWVCPTCPESPPEPGEPCGIGASCRYGDGLCVCIGGWLCDAPCPSELPLRGTPCVDAGQTCVYGDVDCVCANDEYFCN